MQLGQLGMSMQVYSIICKYSTFGVLIGILKGTVSRGGYFFEGLNILVSTFFVCTDGFQDLSKAFHYRIQLLNFYVLL
jgi:hypothetical protein